MTNRMVHAKKIILAVLLLAGVGTGLRAERPEVEAVLSADSVLIGDRFSLRVRITKDRMEMIGFPTFDDGKLSRSGEIEIIAESGIDTLGVEGRKVTISKEYTLAGFDEGDYRMGRFPVLYLDKNVTDTLWSKDSLHIVINTLAVDTLTQTIHDIKPPLSAPVRFGELGSYLLWSLLAAAALALLAVFLYRKYRGRLRTDRKGASAEPPHVTAIKQLEKLHDQKLWQSGKQKLYYTRITDILREYIGERYRIKAPDLTSREILDRMAENDLPERSMKRLREILLTADYVKFAKHIPAAEENENAYTDAYYFVEETKETEQERPVAPDAEPAITEEGKR